MHNIPTYTLQQVLQVTDGHCDADSGHMAGVSIDTRTLQPGNLYVALKGERFDGHRFVSEALKKGAPFVLVQAVCADVPPSAQIVVDDTLTALQALATWRREEEAMRVVGVTGSVGKTGAKDMLSLVLAAQCRTHVTQGNFNNHIGLPLTIVNTPSETELLILEMGMNHVGEIHLLSRIAKPDAAIITTVEAVHLEFFDDVAGIARAKAEIMDGMSPAAPVILPVDNPHYPILEQVAQAKGLRVLMFGQGEQADYRMQNVQVSAEGTTGELLAGQTLLQVHLGALGAHYAWNAAAVLACIDAMGFDLAKAASSLRQYREPPGRGTLEPLSWGGGSITLIDESYNASPVSMQAAFAKLAAIVDGRRTIVVLGDMKELGETADVLHAQLATSLQECAIQQVYLTGAHMAHLARALPDSMLAGHFPDNASLASQLCQDVQPGDIVLFKGSRGSHMEEVMQALKEYVDKQH